MIIASAPVEYIGIHHLAGARLSALLSPAFSLRSSNVTSERGSIGIPSPFIAIAEL
jgi:hypothetical protein